MMKGGIQDNFILLHYLLIRERITIMKNIILYIKENLKRFADFYVNAMSNYGEALNNSRGLVGA